MTEAWQVDAEESCVVVKVNGVGERINRGTISNLGEFINGKAAAARMSKIRVKIDGEEVSPEDIGDYEVADVKEISIDRFDVARE